jgi:hypothetical protein
MNKLFNTYPLVADKEVAAILGLNEALVLQQINYWIEKNRKDNRNFHEGRYWTYNTINEWQEEFPFWSTSTVKRVFKKLRDMNLIIVDNFNLCQMDRTLWYAINYEELEKLIKGNIDNSNEGPSYDTNGQNNTTIGPKENSHDIQNDQMGGTNLTSAIPETYSEISSDISNQSINQSKEEIDRLNVPQNRNKIDYEKIIENCELYAIDTNYREAAAHAIKLLIFDVEKSKMVRIGDNYIPVEIVEKDLNRLNFFVVEHAVNSFKEASTRVKIRNPVGYLKVLIYNSINEINIDMDSKLRYYEGE